MQAKVILKRISKISLVVGVLLAVPVWAPEGKDDLHNDGVTGIVVSPQLSAILGQLEAKMQDGKLDTLPRYKRFVQHVLDCCQQDKWEAVVHKVMWLKEYNPDLAIQRLNFYVGCLIHLCDVNHWQAPLAIDTANRFVKVGHLFASAVTAFCCDEPVVELEDAEIIGGPLPNAFACLDVNFPDANVPATAGYEETTGLIQRAWANKTAVYNLFTECIAVVYGDYSDDELAKEQSINDDAGLQAKRLYAWCVQLVDDREGEVSECVRVGVLDLVEEIKAIAQPVASSSSSSSTTK